MTDSDAQLSRKIYNAVLRLRSRFKYEFVSMTIVLCVFTRFVFAKKDISLDYQAYHYFFDSIHQFTLKELLTSQLNFPYINISKIAPFEFGFVIFSKIFSLVFIKPELTYAAMAALSIGLRVHIMRKCDAPWLWVIIINIYAITLLEANALRLGIAASIIIFGLYQLIKKKNLIAYSAIFVASAFHLQTVIFTIPLIVSWLIVDEIQKYKSVKLLTVCIVGISAVIFTSLIPSIGNEKISEYLSRGQSGSSGITATSVLAVAFTLISYFFTKIKNEMNNNEKVWITILLSSFLSSILLLTLTKVAVVGDRAWQLAFIVLSSFLFSNLRINKRQLLQLTLAWIIAIISVINVTFRYPLSNFFAPIFPKTLITQGF